MNWLVLDDTNKGEWEAEASRLALERVLDEVRGCADKIVCLGDVVGYGPDPAGSVNFCRETCDAVVMGNYDAVVCGLRSDASMDLLCVAVKAKPDSCSEQKRNDVLRSVYRASAHVFLCQLMFF